MKLQRKLVLILIYLVFNLFGINFNNMAFSELHDIPFISVVCTYVSFKAVIFAGAVQGQIALTRSVNIHEFYTANGGTRKLFATAIFACVHISF